MWATVVDQNLSSRSLLQFARKRTKRTAVNCLGADVGANPFDAYHERVSATQLSGAAGHVALSAAPIG